MASFIDNVRFSPTLGGTTDWIVSSAITGYQAPAAAGAVNLAVYRYFAISNDASQWEIGYGAYTVSSTTLARTTVLSNSSGTTAKINFSTVPQVAIVALGEDILSVVPPAGRGSYTSGVAVNTSDVSGATSAYYVLPAGLGMLPLRDGAGWRSRLVGQLSNDTTQSSTGSAGPAACVANSIYDFFAWDNAGVPTLTRGPMWSNTGTVTMTIASPGVVTWTGHGMAIGQPVSFSTSGALPTGIVAGTTYYVISAGFSTSTFEVAATVGGAAINTSGSQSGTHTAVGASYTARGTGAGTSEIDFTTMFASNKNAITNGPAAGLGILLFSAVTDASAQLTLKFGTNAANGGTASISLYNYYNQQEAYAFVGDTTTTWATTGNTGNYLQKHSVGGTGNQIGILQGAAGQPVHAVNRSYSNSATDWMMIGIGINSTTIDSSKRNIPAGPSSNYLPSEADWAGALPLGYNQIVALEGGSATGTINWLGNSTTTKIQGAISAKFWY